MSISSGLGVTVVLEHISPVSVQRHGHTLDTSPVYPWENSETNNFTFPLIPICSCTVGNLHNSSIYLTIVESKTTWK